MSSKLKLILILALLLVLSFIWIDHPLTLFLKEHSTKTLRDICRFLSFLIAPLLHLILWPALFLLAALKRSKWQKKLWHLSINLFVINAAITILKIAVGRPRPKLFYANGISHLTLFSLDSNFHSFPSRHTATIFIVALFFAKLAPSKTWVFLLTALICSLSRIPLNSHYLSDVIGGMLLAMIVAPFTQKILTKEWYGKKKANLPDQ